jgi:hypothetical protein
MKIGHIHRFPGVDKKVGKLGPEFFPEAAFAFGLDHGLLE